MKRVLLLNQGHTKNYGDVAIKETLEKALVCFDLDVAFMPLWSADSVFGCLKYCKLFIRLVHELPYVTDWFYRRYLRKNISLVGFDAIVIGGGELIGGHYGFNSALFVWSKIAKQYNIPIYLYGVSGSKQGLRKRYETRNVKSFSNISKVYVRDSISVNLVKNVYKYSDCIEYPDVVYAYTKIFPHAEFNKKGAGLLVVPIAYISQLSEGMGFRDISQYCDYLVKLIESYSDHDTTIYITSSCIDDESFCRFFYDYISAKGKENLVYYPYDSISSYLDILSNCEFVISGRMHAMILALICGCQVVPIPFKDKLSCFKESVASNYSREVSNLAFEGMRELANCIINS